MIRGNDGVIAIVASAIIGCSSPPKIGVTSDEVANPGQEGMPEVKGFLGRGMEGRTPSNGLTLSQTPAPWRDAARMPLPPAAVIGATGGLGVTDNADTVLSDDRDTWNPCFCVDTGPRKC